MRRVPLALCLASSLAPMTSSAQLAPYVHFREPHVFERVDDARKLEGLDDGAFVEVPTPFGFRFHGGIFNSVWVSARGVITPFQPLENAAPYAPVFLPERDLNGVIAPLWFDGCVSGPVCNVPGLAVGGGVYVLDRGNAVTIEWRDIRSSTDLRSPSMLNFQATLHAGYSGEIEFSYGRMRVGRDSFGRLSPIRARVLIEPLFGDAGQWLPPCANTFYPCFEDELELLENTRLVYRADAIDLFASYTFAPDRAFIGGPIEIASIYENEHDGPIGPARTAAYLVPLAATATIGALRIFDGPEHSFGPFEDIEVRFAVTLPTDLTPGLYVIASTIDDDGQVAELDERNNVAWSSPVRILVPAPNAIVASVSAPAVAERAAIAPVSITFSNDGAEGIELAFDVRISSDAVVTLSDPIVLNDHVTVAAGESITKDLEVEIPADATPRIYVGAIADPAGLVDELDEGDNIGVAPNETLVGMGDLRLAPSLPIARLTVPYRGRVEAFGGAGALTFRHVSGMLPRGLRFDAQRAEVFGIPLELGAFPLELEVSSEDGHRARDLVSLVVVDPEVTLFVATSTLPSATYGVPYAATPIVLGGVPPYRFRANPSLPPGLVFATDGTILGRPSLPGSFAFDLEVADAVDGVASVPLELFVAEPAVLTLATTRLADATVGVPYDAELVAFGGSRPYVFRAKSSLPDGLALEEAHVAGTASTIGVGTFLIQVEDARGSTTTSAVVIDVVDDGQSVELVTTALPEATVGLVYAATLSVRGGHKPLELEIVEGSLPSGVALVPDGPPAVAAGAILTGQIDREGAWPILVRVTDAAGHEDERPLVLVARDAPLPPEEAAGCGCATTRRSAFGDLGLVVLLVVFSCMRARRALALAAAFALLSATAPGAFAQSIYVARASAAPYARLPVATPLNFFSPDDGALDIPIGFAFEYYGRTYSRVNVGVNGAISFAAPCSSGCDIASICQNAVCARTSFPYSPDSIPNIQSPQAVVAAWWDDLSVDTFWSPNAAIRYALRGSAPNRELVVEWDRVTRLGDAGSELSMQIVLEEATKTVHVNYGPITSSPASDWSGLVGIEDHTGTDGLVPLTCGATANDACTATDLSALTNSRISYSPVSGPELVGEARGPVRAMPGALIAAEIVAINIGPDSTGSGFDAKVYLSLDRTLSPVVDPLLGSVSFNALPGNGRGALTLTATVPSGLAPGHYHVIAELDPDDTVIETIEPNNVAVSELLVLVGPDVSPAFDAVPGAAPGEAYSVTFRVVNSNAALADVAWALYVSSDQRLDPSDTLLAQGHTAAPEAASATVTTTATFPSLLFGHRRLIALVDQDDQLVEADETNNATASSEITVGPDLSIQLVSLPPQTGPGETLAIRSVVINSGAPLAEAIYELYLSTDEILDASDAPLLTGIAELLGAARLELTLTATVPDVVPGELHVIARIDPANLVQEANETNNSAVSATTIRLVGPDLVAAELSSNATLFRGKDLVVSVIVRNDGGASVPAFFYSIHLSDNQLITVSDPLLLEAGPVALAPGEVLSARHVVRIPSNFPVGLADLGLIVDSTSAVLEEQEANNIMRRAQRVTVRDPAPDFAISDVVLRGSFAAGERSVVDRLLENAGNGDARLEYSLVVSTDPTLDDRDLVVGSGRLNLAAGQFHVGSDVVELPASHLAGTYYFGYRLDPANDVAEIDETNNFSSPLTVSVAPGPLVLLSTLLPVATVGVPYEFDLVTVGGLGPYEFRVTGGSLPGGLSLAGNGRLSGDPETPGASTFEVTIGDPTISIRRTLSLLVAERTRELEILTRALPPAWAGRPYEGRIVVLGGVPPIEVTAAGSLHGLALSTDGSLTGTPRTASSGLVTFRATDATGAVAERLVPIRVIGADDGVRFSIDTLRSGVVGRAYDAQVRFQNGESPFATSLIQGALPDGLALDGDRIRGTPTRVGEFGFALEVVDARDDFDVDHFVIEIASNEGVRIVSTSLPPATRGEGYRTKDGGVRIRAVSADGAATRIKHELILGALPDGLALGLEGTITGTPAAAGVSSFVVRASDERGQSDEVALGLAVLEPELIVEPPIDEGCSCSASSPDFRVPALGLLALAFGMVRRRRAWVAILAAIALSPPNEARAQTIPYRITETSEPYVNVTGGSPLTFAGTDDSDAIATLPFRFHFFDGDFDRLSVSTNGYLAFGSSGAAFINDPIPSSNAPNGVIAVVWDDLEVPSRNAASIAIRGTAPNRIVIVQYQGIHRLGSEGQSIDAQVWLYEGQAGRLDVRYGPIVGTAGGNAADYSASIGVEDLIGREGFPLRACTPSCDGDDLAALSGTVFTILQDAGEDVIALSASGPLRSFSGSEVDLQVTYQSQHEATLGPFLYQVHLVATNDVEPSDPIYTSEPITLAPYETRTDTVRATIPDGVVPGRYHFALVVDANGEVAEPRESNNTASTLQPTIILEPRPNIVAIAVRSAASTARPGDRLALHVELESRELPIETARANIILSANDVPSGDDLVLATITTSVSTAAPTRLDLEVTVPLDLAGGTYHLGLVVDPEDEVVESRESDNAMISVAPLTVVTFELQILTMALPFGYVGEPYQAWLSAFGGDGTYAWSLASGSLPEGLTLDGSGHIVGDPMTEGSERFTARVVSASSTDERAFEISVSALGGPLTIVTRDLIPAIVGRQYPPGADASVQQQHLVAVGAEGPVLFSLDSVPPAGLTLDTDGLLHGTPTERGVFHLDVRATDGASTATRTLTLTVAEAGRLSVVASELPRATIDEPYIVQLLDLGRIEGADVVFELVDGSGSLPDGLSLASNGQIAGIAERVGSWSFGVSVRDEAGAPSDTARFEIEVSTDAGFGITPSSLPVATLGVAYEAIVEARRGEAPFVWRLVAPSPLPNGLKYEIEDRRGRQVLKLAGTPEEIPLGFGDTDSGGVVSFLVVLEDAKGRSARQPMSLRVVAPPEPPPAPAPQGCGCRETSDAAGSFYVLLGLVFFFARRQVRRGTSA
ncbi:MAG: putative Ig domain-containing protein [Deltaproteobacteria bacterium]|nr:putative Ig domain-containing protein [Deltaproteobacteria bacterium]